MFKLVDENLRGKRILILGFGKEGQSSYRAIRKLYPEQILSIADKNPFSEAQLKLMAEDKFLVSRSGELYLENAGEFDVIIKSPGIPLRELPIGLDMTKVTSHTELFIRCFRDRIVGITGTKGKSTTSNLLYHVLRQEKQDVLLVGNMGRPPLDYLNEITDNTWFVFEMSSHQLEHLAVAPAYAILLNIYQEHLDHYGSYELYQAAKFNITVNQRVDDIFIYNAEDPIILGGLNQRNLARNFYPYRLKGALEQGVYCEGEVMYLADKESREILFDFSEPHTLLGRHNRMNMMAVGCCARLLGISVQSIVNGFKTFTPLEHRMEYVGCFRGIHFYNDSIATIPEACMAAVEALKEVDTLILGGFDRGLDYSGLTAFLKTSAIRNLIFTGEAGSRIRENYIASKHQETFQAEDFRAVVRIALNKTAGGKICLLSPAAASYDWFKNFEERGRIFKDLIRSETLLFS